MKIERHIIDKASYDASIAVLLKDPILHRKLIVEGSVLAATNILNLVLHLSGRLKEAADMKHNKIEGHVVREGIFGEKSFELSKLFRKLEDTKYRVVHGSSMQKDDVLESIDTYKKIVKELESLEPKLKEVLNE